METPGLVPLLGDLHLQGAAPEATDVPPEFHGDFVPCGIGTSQWNRNVDQMKSVCMDRHGSGKTNMIFMDGSSRAVGLKELWTLKWHKGYHTAGPWTKAGGMQPGDWPQWMRRFKEY